MIDQELEKLLLSSGVLSDGMINDYKLFLKWKIESRQLYQYLHFQDQINKMLASIEEDVGHAIMKKVLKGWLE